jgi:hypothetical protein
MVIYTRRFPHSAKIRMTARLAACGRKVGVSPLCEITSRRSIAGITAIANSKSVVAGKDIAGATSSVIPIVRSRAAIALRKMLSAVPSACAANRNAATAGLIRMMAPRASSTSPSARTSQRQYVACLRKDASTSASSDRATYEFHRTPDRGDGARNLRAESGEFLADPVGQTPQPKEIFCPCISSKRRTFAASFLRLST